MKRDSWIPKVVRITFASFSDLVLKIVPVLFISIIASSAKSLITKTFEDFFLARSVETIFPGVQDDYMSKV